MIDFFVCQWSSTFIFNWILWLLINQFPRILLRIIRRLLALGMGVLEWIIQTHNQGKKLLEIIGDVLVDAKWWFWDLWSPVVTSNRYSTNMKDNSLGCLNELLLRLISSNNYLMRLFFKSNAYYIFERRCLVYPKLFHQTDTDFLLKYYEVLRLSFWILEKGRESIETIWPTFFSKNQQLFTNCKVVTTPVTIFHWLKI